MNQVEPELSSGESMTIEELANRASCTTRTIRNYQTQGLLPYPAMDGRVGMYGAGHLARLRLISQLQDQGFSLAGIAQLLANWEEGRSLADLLGFEAALTEPWVDETPYLIPAEELLGRFPEAMTDVSLISRSIDAGLISFEGDQVRVESPGLVEVGATLVASGVPMSATLDELTALRSDLERVATRFVALYDDHVWGPFADRGMPEDEVAGVAEALRKMRPLAATAVEVILNQAMERRSAVNTALRAALDQTTPSPVRAKPADRPASAGDFGQATAGQPGSTELTSTELASTELTSTGTPTIKKGPNQ
ncbi:MAG: MerR family transcriptional regulator [Acidimicrobiales bacterium]